MTPFNTFKILLLGLCSALLVACNPDPDPPANVAEVAAGGLTSGVISADGRLAVVGSVRHGISLWQLAGHERLFDWTHGSEEDTALVAAAFSPDGRWALTADAATLVLWDTDLGKAMRFWSAPGEILSVALGHDGNAALLGLANHTAVLFDVKRGGILRTLHHEGRVRSVALNLDKKVALTGSADTTAVLWNLTNGEAVSRIEHNDEVDLVTLSEDASLALSMAKYDKALVWRAGSAELVGEVPLVAEHVKRGQKFSAARFSRDNQWLLTGRPDQAVTLWQLPGLKIHQQWQVPKRKAWKPSGAAVLDVAFLDGGDHVEALASNGYLARFHINGQE